MVVSTRDKGGKVIPKVTDTSIRAMAGDRLISRARVSLEGDARARFRETAEKRLHAAVTAIRLLGGMAGGNTFDIWLSDVDSIDRHIRSELDIAMAKLRGEKPSIGSMVWDT